VGGSGVGTAVGGTASNGGQTSKGGSAGAGGVAIGGATGGLSPLHVSGTSILDASNNKVVLRGAATIDVGARYNWSGLSDALAQFKASVDLVTTSGWNARVIRIPVYGSGSTRAGEANNFPEDGTTSAQDDWFATILKPAVDYVTSKRLYAIIDWHEISSAAARDAATKKFWTYMAPKFKNEPNVLYEVFNEDSDTNKWTDWQPLAQGWVDIIRNAGASNVALVGGPMWAQTIGGSATKPVTGGNVAYVAHIYCSHFNDSWSKGYIETQVAQAAAAAPLFITEWGYASSESNTTAYLEWLNGFASTYGASWTAWVISSSWTPSMFNADKSPTAFGQSVKDWLAQY
jgi:hypothetical protein